MTEYNKIYVHDWYCNKCGKFLYTSSNRDVMFDPTHIQMFCDECWVKMSECTCGEGIEPHKCPYRSEINDDDTECVCCPICEQECRDNI